MFAIIPIILEQAFLHFPLILGAYISLSLMKVPDLSLETAYVFGAILGARAVQYSGTMPISLTLLIALVASIIGGMLVGLVSSSMTQKAGIPHLLSAILTFGIFHGINQFVLGSSYLSLNIYSNPLSIFALFTRYPELPILALIFCVFALAGTWFLFTQLGYSFAIYGNNNQFFKHYDISTTFVFMSGIIIANALAGVSGYLFAQSNGFLEINMGLGKILLCITAIILGKMLLYWHHSFSVLAPLGGTFIYFALQQLLLKAGLDLKYFILLQAIIILAILVLFYKRQATAPIDHLGI